MSDELISRKAAIEALALLNGPVPPHEFEPGSVGAIALEGMDETWEEAVAACVEMINTLPSLSAPPQQITREQVDDFIEAVLEWRWPNNYNCDDDNDTCQEVVSDDRHELWALRDAILATTPAAEQMKNQSLGGGSE